jgi:hypothetical protein
MKKFLLLFSLSLGICSYSQMSGSEGYLTNGFIEIGINGLYGCEGARIDSVNTLPGGYHYRSTPGFYNLFGFMANPQMDGWIEYNGDFFTPGSPENGWGLTFVTANDTFITCNNNSNISPLFTTINGSITSSDFLSACRYIIWEGTHNDSLNGVYLDVEIKYELCDSDLYYTTITTITNNGDSLLDFYYLRNIDPDNNQPISGDFFTKNTIVQQVTASNNISIVTAESNFPHYCNYALIGNDSLGKVTTGGFDNRNAYKLYNGIGSYGWCYSNVGDSLYSDEAISYVQRKQNFAGSGTFRSGENIFVSKVYSAFDPQVVNNAQTLSNPLFDNQFVNIFYNSNSQNLIVNHNNGFDDGTQIKIINQLGQVIYTITPDISATQSYIPMNNFAGGVYIAVISGNNLNKSIRFVK